MALDRLATMVHAGRHGVGRAVISTRVRRLAADPALRYTALNQLMRLTLGPLVLAVLPLFLSAHELGFWYSMTGLTALLAFADMGLSTAVMQFSAHEYARLEALDDAASDGSAAEERQADALLVFALVRVGRIAAVALPLVFAVGYTIMHGRDEGIAWEVPWAIFCLASAAALLLSVALAYQEGRNAVWPMQRLRAGMAFAALSLTVIGPPIGLGLWTLPLASLASTALGLVGLVRGHLPSLARLRGVPHSDLAKWSAVVSPMLNRYSMSWIGGYLMFQLFAPITLGLAGSALAGRVGLTVSIFTSLFTLANIWSTYRLPLLSIAVARRDAILLRRVFMTGLAASLLTYAAMTVGLLVAYLFVRGLPQVTAKILDLPALLLLAVAWGFQVIVHNAAQFLRAFKVDPLVEPTALAAAHTLLGTVAILYAGHTQLLFLPFVSAYVWLLPAIAVLYRRRAHEIAHWPSAT